MQSTTNANVLSMVARTEQKATKMIELANSLKALDKNRDEIMSELNALLGHVTKEKSKKVGRPSVSKRANVSKRAKHIGRTKHDKPLNEMIVNVLRGQPAMNKDSILAALKANGYKTISKNPKTILGQVLSKDSLFTSPKRSLWTLAHKESDSNVTDVTSDSKLAEGVVDIA
jgi:hypothetical protein